MTRKAEVKRFELLLDPTDVQHQALIKILGKRGRGVTVAGAICAMMESVSKEAERAAIEKFTATHLSAIEMQTHAIVSAIVTREAFTQPDYPKANGQRSAYH
jgi:hypothetical protein